MEIRRILEEEMKSALNLVWDVFLEYEAPDYTDEGIKEFRKTIDDNSWIKDGKHHKQEIGKKLYSKIESLNTYGFFTVNSSPYAHDIYKHLGFFDTADKEQCIKGLRFYPMKKFIIID